MIHWYKMNCMQANPEKFQFIIFDKERQPRTLQLNHNVTIQSVSNVKLLGVNIDVELNFNHHIALLCNRAGRQINALSRLSNVLNVDTKMLILQSFILSHFMYCCIIWHFCSISDTKKIEKMQLKALRHIYKDYTSSYEMLREKCNRPMLCQRITCYYALVACQRYVCPSVISMTMNVIIQECIIENCFIEPYV